MSEDQGAIVIPTEYKRTDTAFYCIEPEINKISFISFLYLSELSHSMNIIIYILNIFFPLKFFTVDVTLYMRLSKK